MVQKKANKNRTVMLSYQSSDSIHVERINIEQLPSLYCFILSSAMEIRAMEDLILGHFFGFSRDTRGKQTTMATLSERHRFL
jgi:hypothetical protein